MRRLLQKLRRSLVGYRYFEERDWARLCSQIRLLRTYSPEDHAQLRDLAEDFLGVKAVEGAAGFEVTLDMKRRIAVQACVPILNLGLDLYDGWYSVVVYAAGFRAPHKFVDEAGVVHEGSRDLSGEAWHQGPVILSWLDVEEDVEALDGMGNVVIHEFAHKLDLLNGTANGMPPLHSRMDPREWTRAFTAAFDDFCQRRDLGSKLPFSDYAATSASEFFAVASEAFFVDPDAVYSRYPDVYRVLSQYYKQETKDDTKDNH